MSSTWGRWNIGRYIYKQFCHRRVSDSDIVTSIKYVSHMDIHIHIRTNTQTHTHTNTHTRKNTPQTPTHPHSYIHSYFPLAYKTILHELLIPTSRTRRSIEAIYTRALWIIGVGSRITCPSVLTFISIGSAHWLWNHILQFSSSLQMICISVTAALTNYDYCEIFMRHILNVLPSIIALVGVQPLHWIYRCLNRYRFRFPVYMQRHA